MDSIIPNCTPESNSSSYRLSPTRLTKLEYNLLRVLYDDHLVQGFTDRGREEISKRFHRDKSTISKVLSDLKSYGFITNTKGGKGRTSRLCITMDGFCYLENQPRHQTRHQDTPIPYIDLSKKEEVDPILKGEQICEQLPELEPEPEKHPIDTLDNFLLRKNVSVHERESIKNQIHSSRIGPVRTQKLIERIINPKQANSIRYHKSFVQKCIENEQKEIKQLFNVFRGKNVPVRLYAQQ